MGNLKRFNAKRKLRAEIVAIKMDNRMQKFLLGLRVEATMIDMLRNSASDAPNISLAAPLKSFGSCRLTSLIWIICAHSRLGSNPAGEAVERRDV